MMRAVSRHDLFRSVSAHLESRAPDDIWFDERWFMVFALRQTEGDDVLVFTLQHASPGFRVVTATRVRRRTDGEVLVVSATDAERRLTIAPPMVSG